MRRLLVLAAVILMMAPVLKAQKGNTILLSFPGVPTGTCAFVMLGLNASNGNVYSCVAGTWTLSGSGFNPASPGPIGGTTPSTGVFTTVTANGTQPQITAGTSGTSGQLALAGATSGTATITAPNVAGTATNPMIFSNYIKAPGQPLSVTTSIGSSQILNMFTTPVTIVPAGGSGTLVKLIDLTIFYKFGTAAYAANTTLTAQWTGSVAGVINSSIGSLISATVDSVAYRTAANSGSPPATSTLDNQPITLSVSGGNPTTGDGTLSVVATYLLMTRP